MDDKTFDELIYDAECLENAGENMRLDASKLKYRLLALKLKEANQEK